MGYPVRHPGSRFPRERLRKYSVYEVGTDRPICTNGTAQECAAALGIKLNSFYWQMHRLKDGLHTPRKYEIFIDDDDEEDLEA